MKTLPLMFVFGLISAPVSAQLPTFGIMIQRDRLVEADTILINTYSATPTYQKWWREIAACTKLAVSTFNPLQGVSEAPDAANWKYVAVNADAFLVNSSGPFIGYTFVSRRQIWIIAKYASNPRLLKHEMTHALMYEHGMPAGHPAKYFDKCEVAT